MDAISETTFFKCIFLNGNIQIAKYSSFVRDVQYASPSYMDTLSVYLNCYAGETVFGFDQVTINIVYRKFHTYISRLITGGNRTMVAAATIVSTAAADGERISIFPLVCLNKACFVSFSVPDI